MNLQKKNLQSGREFEEKVLDNIKSECSVSSIVDETSGGFSTPDLLCVKKGEEKTLLVEAKKNGYVRPSQRSELVDIADRSPENVEIQVAYPDKEGGINRRTVYGDGKKAPDTEKILDSEFFQEKV